MLDLAINKDYETQLKKAYAEAVVTERCKYYITYGWVDYEVSISRNEWDNYQRVSVKNGKVIGYLSGDTQRAKNVVTSLSIISFAETPEEKMEYAKDIRTYFKCLLKKFDKIKFTVAIGNKVEKNYDKFVDSLNGRIIGISIDDAMLADGTKLDMKYYEILKKNLPSNILDKL